MFRLLAFICLVYPVLSAASAAPTSLFDGRTLAGWEGDPKWWRVEDGALTGGSTTEKIPHNYFLATTRSFQNFDLRLKIKLTGDHATGLINSGIQIRSIRVPGTTHMAGYQVDAGDNWWGKMYDEARRRKVIAEAADLDAVNAAVHSRGWNDYRILAEGPRIRSWINGVPAIDYTETEDGIARDGHIGIQIHSGGVALVQVKDVTIQELPPTPGAPTWAQVGLPKVPAPKKDGANEKKSTSAVAPASPAIASTAPATVAAAVARAVGPRDISYNTVTTEALTPEEELRTFLLPAGFEAELVAAESDGVGKFIGLAWDAKMQLWSMTALEYPVDGNEQKAASDALFARGGRDRVVVFDHPYGAPAPGAPAVTSPPRVFADGLVMPLGILPYKDGVYVQYGPEIRLYRDRDGDGHADGYEVILTGFGTQDSHLFPHQFLRQPGGQVFVAQGLFNYSTVRRPDGRPFDNGETVVPFDQCKLARFALDGSSFETLTAGPNNIWGLHTSREGETFLQEANDFGYSVIPYEFGIHVRTGSRDLLRPYQPLMPPPMGNQLMGGTGLSGLALAEDHDGFFRSVGSPQKEGTKVFFLANPLANSIQVVHAIPDGPRYRYEKQNDFLTTKDRWFRPVALHFGPDGALYIVDWYNKIISHNEVPRDHPDRDKQRGRIWRIRQRDQPRDIPPDLTRLEDRALLAQLGGPNALVSRLAWLEIVDRQATALAPELEKIVRDRAAATDRRLGALWALEGLRPVPTASLQTLAADPAYTVRHEAARLAAASPRPEAEFLAVVRPLISDTYSSVRVAVADSLRRVPKASPGVMALAAQLGRASLSVGEPFERYEREHERFLARWAMETHRESTRAFLASAEGRSLPLENRLLATLALGGRDAALGVAELASSLDRPLGEEEVRALAGHFAESKVRGVLETALRSPNERAFVLRALLILRTGMDAAPLVPTLTEAARAQLASDTAEGQVLGAEVIGAFKLSRLAPELGATLESSWRDSRQPIVVPALRALRELGSGSPALLAAIVEGAPEPNVRDEALATLIASKASETPSLLVSMLPKLTVQQRGRVLTGLAGSPAGASALVAGMHAGTVSQQDIGLATLDRLHAVLPDDPFVTGLWQELGGDTGGEAPLELTPAEAAAERAKFASFRALARARGNPENGRELFNAMCLNCHAFAGKGGQIAPPLDGMANSGMDALLRNILTPSDAMESAYRTFRVTLNDGSVLDAFLVAQTEEAYVVRIPGAEERRIPRSEVKSAGYTRRSLMPEGLLEALPSEQVSDLFSYINSLR